MSSNVTSNTQASDELVLHSWKKKRRILVLELVDFSFHDYEVFHVPNNPIRSMHRLSMKGIKATEQEKIFFDDFIHLCRGSNTRSIQCEQDENGVIFFTPSEDSDDNVKRWLLRCFDPMVKNLFELELCISRLRSDKTRGPVVLSFCSIVLKYLRKNFHQALNELEKLQCKNLLTLHRKCNDLNSDLRPLLNIAKEIEKFDLVGGELINKLFEETQSDHNSRVIDLLKNVTSLALKRYCEVIYEWISQCTLTFDLAHEFFIWDLEKCKEPRKLTRNDFVEPWDGTEFGKRFVIIDETCPDIFQPVKDDIINTGMYLYTMKSQRADLDMLMSQLNLDPDTFRNKTISEMRGAIRDVYEKCAINILNHLNQKFDIQNLALRLPNYYLGMNSTWIEELVVFYEDEGLSASEPEKFTPVLLRCLLDKAIDNDWLRDDPFRKRIILEPIGTRQGEDALQFDVKLNGDATLCLAVPNKILVLYQKMFRLSFLMQRARYLLHKKRFSDPNFFPQRDELVTMFLLIRFVHVYHNFIFSTVAEDTYKEFRQKLSGVKNLTQLVDVQFNFLEDLFERSHIRVNSSGFADCVMKLITLASNYARNEITFAELNTQAGPVVYNMKKVMEKGEYSNLKHLLFGGNSYKREGKKEPLWMSLRHIDASIQ
ncbi:spc97 / spc98 family domain-containing protein [Ditylenchus destructor]|nr:spc97 / spc98 family domain-containing protein [Ditylenchus destructor]